MTEKINCVLFSEEGYQANTTGTRLEVASYPGLLTQVFITCSTNKDTASDKHRGEKV